jgi:DDE family transposase
MASVTRRRRKGRRQSAGRQQSPRGRRPRRKGQPQPAHEGAADRAARGRRIIAQLDDRVVEQICLEQGHGWRDGKLPPGRTVECFAWQVLMGNETCAAVRHRGGCEFSSPAYCMARRRLPLEVLEELNGRVRAEALALAGAGRKGEHRWKGRRVFRIDGSSTSLPDVPEVRRYFGLSNKQKPGCGYPTAHLLVLTGPAGVAMDLICSPLRTGDMTHAAPMHRHLQRGDVLLGDGLFSGWGHLWLLQTERLDGVFPAHHSRKIAFGARADHGQSRRFVKSLGYYDQLVRYRKPDRRPDWMSKRQFAAAPQWITVREVRRSVWVGGVRRTVTIVTTLRDPGKYPAKALAKLLGERWAIEVDLRSLKTTLGMERLRCRSVEGVKKLAMYLIVYNLVRMRMPRAAARQKVPLTRISFADALAALRYGHDEQAELKVNPDRPGRSEPRVVKTRPKAYAKMSRTRAQLRRELLARRKAAFA